MATASSPTLLFVNLPVRDLARSVAFYEAIGATRNAQFSDHTAACMVVSDTIFVMLLTHAKFSEFCPLPIADAHASAQALLCLSRPDRAAVDAIVEAAAQAGGRADIGPTDDHGFMYGRNFADPDGHIWAPFWMDPAAVKADGEEKAA
jgi:predicted lactoylglutathione lyase